MRIWGYWATFGWGLLALVVGQFAALALVVALNFGTLDAIVAAPYDGALVTLFIALANPVTIAVLVGAVATLRAPPAEYLALIWPDRRSVAIGMISLAVLIAGSDLLLYLGGYPLVTPFQAQSYTSAGTEGWLVGLWLSTVIVAPAGEEALFRGFLFRGWVRSKRAAWPAIVIISLLWAGLHIQYDWTGILQIFVSGLVLGWMRWRSGSTLLTFFMHALFNLEGTLETIAYLYLSK
jgi:membrane protease YdiL (CAAX protease family)